MASQYVRTVSTTIIWPCVYGRYYCGKDLDRSLRGRAIAAEGVAGDAKTERSGAEVVVCSIPRGSHSRSGFSSSTVDESHIARRGSLPCAASHLSDHQCRWFEIPG